MKTPLGFRILGQACAGLAGHRCSAPTDATGRLRANLSVIVAALALSMSAVPAWADATATKNGGDWFDDSAWTFGVPSAADTATISAGDTLRIERIGAGANILYDNGSLEVKSTGSPASSLGVGLQLVVGLTNFGEVKVSAGGHVASANTLVGYSLTSGTGFISVDGEGSTWVNSGQFFVGGAGASAGAGVVHLTDGGKVTTTNASISVGSSTGTVDINHSTWTNTNLFSVGDGGSLGQLFISNGGALNTLTGAIGNGSGGTGSLTTNQGTAYIDKASWNNAGDLYVGGTARGRLTVVNGGLVTSTIGYVGYGANSIATASFSHATWTNASVLFVGYDGDGTLDIKDGATVTSAQAILGRYGQARGAVTVDDAAWTNTGDLFVGHGVTGLPNTHPSGQLVLRNGGSLSSATGFIGYGTGSAGTVEVKGINAGGTASTWNAGGLLQVSERGSALLTISDGGIVTAQSTVLGPAGTLHVNGTESRRGVLETGHFLSTGGAVDFDGGLLRATADQATFLQNVGLVTVYAGGMFADSNGHAISLDTTLTGPGGLTKLGLGTMTLPGNSALGKLSTVAEGQLLVNGRFSGDLQVNAGATLGGSGQILGAVNVLAGGILSPGNSPGTLQVGTLTLDADSRLRIELGASSDLLIVDGDLTLDGTIDFLGDPGFFAAGQLPSFLAYSGTLTDRGLVIGLLPSGIDPRSVALDFSTPGLVGLGIGVPPPVPEPATAAMLALGGLLLLTRAQRRPGRCKTAA